MQGRDLTTYGTPRLALFGGRPPKFQLGLVDGRWKFILEDYSEEMLYDLSVDPNEQQNLASRFPDVAASYHERIEQYQAFSENLIENYADILARSSCAAAPVGQ